MGVKALEKPFGQWCKHCKPGVGCTIYDSRPQECRTFFCMWLADATLGPEWRPDRSKIVITMASNYQGLEIRCDPGFPDAWRREPYHRQIVSWAHGAWTKKATVAVWVGNRATMIGPEGEIPLGQLRDDDEIVSEFADDRLLSVRVAKGGAP